MPFYHLYIIFLFILDSIHWSGQNGVVSVFLIGALAFAKYLLAFYLYPKWEQKFLSHTLSGGKKETIYAITYGYLSACEMIFLSICVHSSH